MKTVDKRFGMYLVLLAALIFPANGLAADNMMINAEIKEIELETAPMIGASFTPGEEPGVVISPPEGKSGVISGYRVRNKAVAYIVGVSCEADLSDDCSAYPYREDYQQRTVTIRYIQAADPGFRTPEGARIGDRWDQTVNKAGGQQITYAGNDSCVRLPSGWHACVDPMSAERAFDLNLRRSMPKKKAKIDFYYKSYHEK